MKRKEKPRSSEDAALAFIGEALIDGMGCPQPDKVNEGHREATAKFRAQFHDPEFVRWYIGLGATHRHPHVENLRYFIREGLKKRVKQRK